MKPIMALLLCATPVFAGCTPQDQTCQASIVTGDVPGSVPLIHCEAGVGSPGAGIKYNGANATDVYNVCYPKGATLSALPIRICIPGNGYDVVTSQHCPWGTSTNSAQIVIPAENSYSAWYFIAYQPYETGLWPLGMQDVSCFIDFLVANAGASTTVPGNIMDIGMFAISAGTTEAWWLPRSTAATPFGRGACANAGRTEGTYRYTGSVLASSPFCLGLKTGICAAGSTYDGGGNPGSSGNVNAKTAINGVLGVASSAAAASQDAALSMSPANGITPNNAFAVPELWELNVGCAPYPDGVATSDTNCPAQTVTGTNGDTTIPPSVNAIQLQTYLATLNIPVWNTYFLNGLSPGAAPGGSCPVHTGDLGVGVNVCNTGAGGLQGKFMPFGLMFLANTSASSASGGNGASI